MWSSKQLRRKFKLAGSVKLYNLPHDKFSHQIKLRCKASLGVCKSIPNSTEMISLPNLDTLSHLWYMQYCGFPNNFHMSFLNYIKDNIKYIALVHFVY